MTDTTHTTDTTVSFEDFRAEARAWVAEHLQRREPGRFVPMGNLDVSPEQVAASRVIQRTLFDGGYAGISYPVEYGGRGLTAAHERAFREESRGYVLPEFGGAGKVMFTAIGRSMLAHATPELLHRHIPPLLSGEHLWCQFYSEPEAGSDLAGIRTTATRDGDHWVIRGSKIWSTGAHHADWAMCLARTDWDAPKHRGLTWFAVPTNAPGVTVRPIRQIAGDAEFCEAFLDDVVVPADAMIGDLHQGWSVAQTMLVYERGGGESGTVMVEPRNLAPDLVDLAGRVGRLEDPEVRQAIARAHANDFALYHLGRRISARIQGSANPQPGLAAYAKLAIGVFGPQRGRAAMEIGGSEALLWDEGEAMPTHTVGYLNARQMAIAAGTNEVQRNGIGERVLGLPREPSFDSNKPFSEVVRDARSWNGKVS